MWRSALIGYKGALLSVFLLHATTCCCVWRMGKMGAPWGWYGVEECI